MQFILVTDTDCNELFRTCGFNIPAKIISSGNKLIVKFKSDEFSNFKGFRATWKEVTETSREIASPNYPDNYPDNSNVGFIIAVASRSRIELSFVDFQIESVKSCVFDFVEGRYHE